MKNQKFPLELYNELVSFEDFLEKIGLKRIEGRVYGLLVLSETPLSSEEIQQGLNISQSAVSNALKTLLTYKTIMIIDNKEKGCRCYEAVESTLGIVSQVLRKREREFIRDYKNMAERLTSLSIKNKEAIDGARMKRLNSIIVVSQLGEMIISFIIALDELEQKHKNYAAKAIKNLPKMFDFIIKGQELVSSGGKNIIKDVIGDRFKTYLDKFNGENREQ